MRGVLFDFAGTLLMPLPARELVARAAAGRLDNDEVDTLARAYERAGMPGGSYPDSIPEKAAEAYAARDAGPIEHERGYVALLRTAGEPWPGFAEAAYREIRSPDSWVAYPDGRAVVDALVARSIAVAIVSNVGFDIRPILRAHGFPDLAERCVLSFEVGAAKPDPTIYRAALEVLGTAPADTLMVGDHPEADGVAAEALGIHTLILPMTPPGSRHGLQAVVDRVSSTPPPGAATGRA